MSVCTISACTSRAKWAAVPLGIALAVLPVAWRAHFIGGEVSATMSVGQVAFVGNRPEGTGVGAVTPSALKLLEQQFLSPERPDYAHVLFRRFAREAVSGEGAAAEGYWLQLVAAFAQEEPSGFLAQLTRKASWFLAGPIAHDIRGVRTMEARVREVLPVDPAWLAICGLAGLVLRARRRTARVLLATEALWLVLALVFYVTGRYALPSLVLLTAGFGPFVRALARPRAWRRGALLPAGVAVTLFAAWASHEWAFGPLLAAGAEAREGLSAFHEARRTGDEARARAGWVEAVGAQPLLLMTADLVGFPPDAPELAFAAGASRARRIARDTELDRLALAQLAVTAGRCDEVKAALVELQGWPGWSMFDVPLAPLEPREFDRDDDVTDAYDDLIVSVMEIYCLHPSIPQAAVSSFLSTVDDATTPALTHQAPAGSEAVG